MIFVIEISATHYKPLLKKMRTPPVDNDMIGSAKDILSLPPSPDLMGVRTFDIFLGNHNFVFIVLKQPSILNIFWRGYLLKLSSVSVLYQPNQTVPQPEKTAADKQLSQHHDNRSYQYVFYYSRYFDSHVCRLWFFKKIVWAGA